MSDYQFLAHQSDPFGARAPLLVLAGAANSPREINPSDLGAIKVPILTYNAWSIIDTLRFSQASLPPCLIDIGDALRLRSGLSRDQGGEAHWDVWRELSKFLAHELPADATLEFLQSRRTAPSPQEAFQLLCGTAVALRSLWEKVTRDLSALGEIERFSDIEVPIQQIFLRRQYLGIHLSTQEIEAALSSARNAKYKAFRQVAAHIGVSPSGLGYQTVGKFIDRTDVGFLNSYVDSRRFEEYFKIVQHRSVFASVFVDYMKSSQDYSVLTRLRQAGEIAHPIFQCFGTVTGRILVSEPRLQELRKRYRNVIKADEGNDSVYLDYSQFEPGILADAAGDIEFVREYHGGDLYSSLSVKLFGDRSQRNVCKRIFLAYCYGMSVENIALLLVGDDTNTDARDRYTGAVRDFFAVFPDLEKYKKGLENRLESDGVVGSRMGNLRRRTSAGPLSYKERRWAVSQVIQGTASLIFKNALIDLAKRFGESSILLPMHDAVLLQYDRERVPREAIVAEASEVMKSAFRKWCPSIEPRVTASDFAA